MNLVGDGHQPSQIKGTGQELRLADPKKKILSADRLRLRYCCSRASRSGDEHSHGTDKGTFYRCKELCRITV